MNQDPLEQELREKAWRGPLEEGDQARLDAWLAAHPDARAAWETDAALSAAIARLPEKRAPSNLTARVLAEIEREDPAGRRRRNWYCWIRTWRWLPHSAVLITFLALVTGGFAYQRHRAEVLAQRQAQVLARQQAQVLAQQRAKAVQPIATAAASTLPSPEVLQDLDVIIQMPPMPGADAKLLTLLE